MTLLPVPKGVTVSGDVCNQTFWQLSDVLYQLSKTDVFHCVFSGESRHASNLLPEPRFNFPQWNIGGTSSAVSPASEGKGDDEEEDDPVFDNRGEIPSSHEKHHKKGHELETVYVIFISDATANQSVNLAICRRWGLNSRPEIL